MPMTMFNKSEIMRLAWVWARQDLWAARLPASQLRRLFRAALVRAWADAKRMAAYQMCIRDRSVCDESMF